MEKDSGNKWVGKVKTRKIITKLKQHKYMYRIKYNHIVLNVIFLSIINFLN